MLAKEPGDSLLKVGEVPVLQLPVGGLRRLNSLRRSRCLADQLLLELPRRYVAPAILLHLACERLPHRRLGRLSDGTACQISPALHHGSADFTDIVHQHLEVARRLRECSMSARGPVVVHRQLPQVLNLRSVQLEAEGAPLKAEVLAPPPHLVLRGRRRLPSRRSRHEVGRPLPPRGPGPEALFCGSFPRCTRGALLGPPLPRCGRRGTSGQSPSRAALGLAAKRALGSSLRHLLLLRLLLLCALL
mmetsp:Transcript_71945/g.159202  ORF Transcript_71945/g.159202 Transcript_71945/m.159202 type:complete len:246 (+) Transcript_71945:316-1053(+)